MKLVRLRRALFSAEGTYHEKGSVISLPDSEVPSSAEVLGEGNEETLPKSARPKKAAAKKESPIAPVAPEAVAGDTLSSLAKKDKA